MELHVGEQDSSELGPCILDPDTRNVAQIGVEDKTKADNLFDIAIGNVPFGSNTVYDKRYKDRFLIHDYFFQKTLDKVRDGGIIAFITTDGTLDKKDTRVREYIAKRAEFLGAIRLPNNTFTNNANAKVTSDIIFLKKRDELKQDLSDEKWIYTSELLKLPKMLKN